MLNTTSQHFLQLVALATGHFLNVILMQLQGSAKKVQKRLINKPRHPAQVAADVVEQVLRTGAEPYLETMQHKLSWWQLSLLDVKLFLAAVASLVIVLALFVVASVVRVCAKGIQTRSSFQKKMAWWTGKWAAAVAANAHMHLLLASTFALMADLVLLCIDLLSEKSFTQWLLPQHCCQKSPTASFCDLQ
jgi:ABC-type multidrug transport system fused ATPase/permease subunit